MMEKPLPGSMQLDSEEGELVPTPIPALVVILVKKEQEKGSPLTESEVMEARDNAVCMMLPASVRVQMEASRGYPDLDLEHAWEQWQTARLDLK